MSERPVVHLVDDEAVIRRSIGFLLRTSGYDVHNWPSGTAFLKAARHAPTGCVLLDVRMPDMDGLDVQAALIAQGIDMPIIIMTAHGDVGIAVRAMKAGAIDFLEKPFERASLLATLASAASRIADSARAAIDAEQARTRIAALTPRERAVLDDLARGLSNKSIAADLGISARTVEVHRANLMAKLGVPSFPDALRIAFAAGLGPPPVMPTVTPAA